MIRQTASLIVWTFVSICGCSKPSDSARAEALNPNTPSWYKGNIPWAQLPLNIRTDLARTIERRSHQKPPLPPADRGLEGMAILGRIAREYGLRDSTQVSRPNAHGSILWIPDSAWVELSSAERASLDSYVLRTYSHGGIGVGSVKDGRIEEGRIVVEH
jgi:hypothetical protein